MLHYTGGRCVHEFAVQAVLPQHEAGNYTDGIAQREAIDVRSESFDGAGGLVPEDGWEGRLGDVLAGPEHHLGAVQTHRLDPDLDLAGLRRRYRHVLDLEDLGAPDFMEAYDARHGLFPVVGAIPADRGWAGVSNLRTGDCCDNLLVSARGDEWK